MEIKDQVCTLEQAKRLKELGVTQDSYFSWCGDEAHRLVDNGKDGAAISNWVFISTTIPVNNQQADYREDVPSAKPFAAAYTVPELAEMLPNQQAVIGWEVWYNDHIGEWVCTIRDFVKWKGGKTPPPVAHESEGDTMAEALADALIHCIENNLVTPHRS